MDSAEIKRHQNERKFGNWESLPGGGRRYWCEVTGRAGRKARYVKEVDSKEETVRFWQEIYDEQGKPGGGSPEVPVDLGHQRVR